MASSANGGGTIVVIVNGPVEVVLGALRDGRPDLGLIDALARIHLAARRLGCVIRVRQPCQELCELLDLVGLAELVAEVDPPS